MEVYMDNAATTRAYPEVVQLMNKIMEEDYGNRFFIAYEGRGGGTVYPPRQRNTCRYFES